MNKITVLIFWTFVLIKTVTAQQSVADSLSTQLVLMQNDTAKIIMLNKLAKEFQSSNPKKSLQYATEALKISDDNNYFEHVTATYSTLAAANWALGNYSLGLDYLFKKLKIHETKKEYLGIAETYKHIAIILNDNDEDSLALSYLFKSLKISKEHKNKIGVADAYNIIASIRFANYQTKDVENYWQKALQIYKVENKILKAASVEHNLAMLYYENEDYERALKSFNTLLKTCVVYKNNLCIATVLENIGSIYLKTEEYQLAEKYFIQMLDSAKKYRMPKKEMDAYLLLAELDTLQKNYQSAYTNFTKYTNLKDRIFTQDKEKQISELQIQYETEKTEQENVSLRKAKQVTNLIILVLGISLVSVVLILFFLWKMIQIKQANNLILTKKSNEILLQKNKISEQNEELRIQSEELVLHEKHLREQVYERTKELLLAKERAEESDKLKSAFLANISHEIRTPMNAIVGFSDLLAGKDISKTDRDEYLKIIQKSSNNLLNLINDIIDLSKIEVNTVHISKVKFKLNDVMLELLSSFSDKATAQVHLYYDNKINNDGVSINTDLHRFKQIMSNLLDNALKFTSSGQINFGYTINNQLIEFYVKDTGIGISKHEKETVFNHFRKIENSNIKLYQGTGLGLAISKSLTEMLGGKMWLDTNYKTGSLFKFNLPTTT